MLFFVVFLVLVVVAVIGVVYYQRIHRPYSEMRMAIHRLANGDFRPIVMGAALPSFRNTAGDIHKISDLLREQVRQLADEGFNLRAILSSMIEGVLIVDSDLRIRLVNESVEQMFGLAQSPINRTVIEVFRRHEIQQAILEAVEKNVPQRMEMGYEHRQGGRTTMRYFEVSSMALTPNSGSKAIGAVAVFHDITEVKNLETVRKEFVANVSHEFRTPLSIIHGYIETLSDGALDDRPLAEKALRVMHKHTQRMNLLIDDLLTISRLEYRSAPLNFEPVNLRLALDHAIEQLEPSIRERNAEVKVEFSKEESIVEADARRIEQVYVNLLTNALQYGAREMPAITISSRREGNFVTICIQDNGPGIPLDDQPHIFERFYRVHKDRSRDAGGTGLGLSIVKNIILAHGGEVSLESTPGQGAGFLFRLPVTQLPN
ncbi:MAG: ATP-binding protein [Chthoniobacterales bacterium]